VSQLNGTDASLGLSSKSLDIASSSKLLLSRSDMLKERGDENSASLGNVLGVCIETENDLLAQKHC
jgi:hypothetical protein